jgi:hypothetical protein
MSSQMKEVPGERPGRIPRAAASVLMELGVCHPSRTRICSTIEKLSESHHLVLFWDFVMQVWLIK